MKNIFKFNRVFSVLLLLSVANASAVRFDYDANCFDGIKANRSTTAPAATIPAAPVVEVATPTDLLTGFGVSEGHIKAEVPAATVSRLSEAGRVLKLHGQMALDKGQKILGTVATAISEHPTKVAAVVIGGTVIYLLHKRFTTKPVAPAAPTTVPVEVPAAPKAPVATPTVPVEVPAAPYVNARSGLYNLFSGKKSATPVESVLATPTRKAPVMVSEKQGWFSNTVTIKTPTTFPEFISLNNDLKKDPTNKNILSAMQTGFTTSGNANAGIVRYLARQFSVENTAEVVNAKLAELMTA